MSARGSWRSAAVFVLPAVLLLAIFVVYPALYTILLSFDRGRGGVLGQWVGLDNYERVFSDPDFITFPPGGAVWNNILWLIFYTGFVILLGLIIAAVAARVRYESLVKAVVFLPMAIAGTALAVIWRFVYAPDANTGLLNAILGNVGLGPIPWLGDPDIVNASLIAVGVWASVGFATVILSAALKGVPAEILESARVEGAGEFQVFLRIIVPMISLPISVLAITLIVNVIKLFDLIFVMTGGGPGRASRVIAFTMYQQAFQGGQYGYGSAVAVVMLVILLPVMIYNVRRFRGEAGR